MSEAQTVEERLAAIKGQVAEWRAAFESVTGRGHGFALINNDAALALDSQEWLAERLEEARLVLKEAREAMGQTGDLRYLAHKRIDEVLK